jgi:glycosyltransferase involved in cell wall biosynthesis
MEALVSAVITTYKRKESFLIRAIESVLNQSYSNIELLVVDDNGIDSSYHDIVKNVVQSYSDKMNVKHIAHETNMGAQRARNEGIKQAKGDFIAFLDDDDEWLETKIEKQLRVFKESPNEDVGLVYCWYNVLTEEANNSFSIEKRSLPIFSQEEVLKELFRNNYIASTSFPLIKKNCFNKVGLFDENLEASQDYDMWVRIAKEYNVACVDEPLVNYYKHQGERITSNPEKKARAEKEFLKKHSDFIKKDPVAYSDKCKKIGIYLMRTGEGREARRYFIESIKKEPIGLRIYKYYLESFILQWKLNK